MYALLNIDDISVVSSSICSVTICLNRKLKFEESGLLFCNISTQGNSDILLNRIAETLDLDTVMAMDVAKNTFKVENGREMAEKAEQMRF